MKKPKVKVTALLLISALCFCAFGVRTAPARAQDALDGAEYVEGEAVVILKDNAEKKYSKKSKAQALYGENIRIKDSFDFDLSDSGNELRGVTVKSADKSTRELLDELKNNEAVEKVIPNYIVRKASLTDDTYSDYQWALNNTGQNCGTPGVDIDAEALWEKAEESKRDQIVAVIDTGIDYYNEDLRDVLWVNPYGDKLKGVYGYDFTGENEDGTPYDTDGHGTNIAGIIAACANNGKGISGVNRRNTKIMSLKFMEEDGGTIENEIKAFAYVQDAIKLGANVVAVNCSFGSSGHSVFLKEFYDELFDQLGSMGVVTCVAAGNEHLNLNDRWFDDYYLPACSDSEYCVTVGASDESDNPASFSNYGDEYVDIAAPGTDIITTGSENRFFPSVYSPEKRSETCLYFQDYNSGLPQGGFGHAGLINLSTQNAFRAEKSILNESFGLGGGALSFTGGDEAYSSVLKYCVEIPFSLENEDGDYYISFMYKSLEKTFAYAADVPADFDTVNMLDSIKSDGEDFSFSPGTDWNHVVICSKTSSEDYEKSADRKLVLYFKAKGQVIIDDVAVSRQNIAVESFGKYELCSGTSMACPFVAGAVALVKNAYNDCSAKKTAKFLKTRGRVSEALKGYVNNGYSLSLGDKNFLDTEPEETIPAPAEATAANTTVSTQPITAAAAKIKNTLGVKAKKVNVKYGKKTNLKPSKYVRIIGAVGKLTFIKTKGNKKITVTKKGKMVIKKGLKKGTYKVRIKITAAGNDAFEKVTKTVSVKIKVK